RSWPDFLHHIHLPPGQAKHAAPVALRLRPGAAHEYKPPLIIIFLFLLPRRPPPLLFPPIIRLLPARLPVFPPPLLLLSPLHRLLPARFPALPFAWRDPTFVSL